MSVKTVLGATKQATLTELVMQGYVPGPFLCSNQMLKNSNRCFKEGSVHMYMNKVPIGPLTMVDDITTVVACDSVEGIDANIKNENFVK